MGGRVKKENGPSDMYRRRPATLNTFEYFVALTFMLASLLSRCHLHRYCSGYSAHPPPSPPPPSHSARCPPLPRLVTPPTAPLPTLAALRTRRPFLRPRPSAPSSAVLAARGEGAPWPFPRPACAAWSRPRPVGTTLPRSR